MGLTVVADQVVQRDGEVAGYRDAQGLALSEAGQQSKKTQNYGASKHSG
jgi:hypothetical protein